MEYLKFGLLLLMVRVNTLYGLWDLSVLKNTYVVDISESGEGENVIFECPVVEETKVYWLIKGNQRPGRILRTHVMEDIDAGNFTCHRLTGELIDYKVVLLNTLSHLNQRLLPGKQPIQCEAQNYSGHFKCTWKRIKKHVQYIFEAQRGNYTITCEKPSENNRKYEVNCHDNESCQYGEESHNINILLHILDEKRYENHSLTFMLRDITKPDPPAELKISSTSLTWSYPKTWCNVHSFFPLIFNVNITKGNKSPEHHQGIDVPEMPRPPNGKFSFCVQARDMYYNSSWSEWSCSK
ncbi:hypothetical protein XENTR_v10007825 [Xenopus tropicalis]|nr:interleukin-12 subunit beta isoform X2 [Xenopus tropicalis]KAE8613679.1 hypothetical protein XENTR_v10007825 [Xenopus tropicalis]KAE8613680.1 hypothetical protein XENTR_v10007825 [Xenopus tropicalis]